MISETGEALFQLDTFNPRSATSPGVITIDIRASYQTMEYARVVEKNRALYSLSSSPSLSFSLVLFLYPNVMEFSIYV